MDVTPQPAARRGRLPAVVALPAIVALAAMALALTTTVSPTLAYDAAWTADHAALAVEHLRGAGAVTPASLKVVA